MTQPHKPAPARPAASILLIRDGARGREVLMLERARTMAFAPGAVVFPGGRVDRGDWHTALRRHGRGSLNPTDLAHRSACIREAFEEVGLLLARDRRTGRSVTESRRLTLDHRVRRRLTDGGIRLTGIAQRARLEFAPEALVPFAHWITPEPLPKRFDTRFYLVAAPRGQRARGDGSEAVELAWHRPADMLGGWEEGRTPLMFPTRLNLMKLARADTVAQALAQARATPVFTVLPKVSLADGRRSLTIPAEAGYGVTAATQRDFELGA